MKLRISPLPLAVPEYQTGLLWTAANEQDLGLQWLVELIATAFGQSQAHPRIKQQSRRDSK